MKRKNSIDRSIPKVIAVDLFCGAGGLTYGLRKSGIDVQLGVDIDKKCEYPYTANNDSKFLLKSVESLKKKDIEKYFKGNNLRLIAGCAPCQTFSTYNQKATPKDGRWWLLLHFSKLVARILPDLVTMENVPQLKNRYVFEEFLTTLRKAGYHHVFHDIVKCQDYGVPQNRKRLVFLASRLGPIALLSPSEFGARKVTVKESIASLSPLESGEIDKNDSLHQASVLSKTNLKRIRASRPGGTWRDWKDALIADCHRKESGKTYPSVYGRMEWDEPAPTITTQFFGFGNGRFGHPEQDRAISLREGAILQGFPKKYKFVKPGDSIRKKDIGRLIGNAVPPILGEVIGLSILAHVESHSKKSNIDISHRI
ncbi:MAG: DNA cytosine methyltransferase [Spirochaetes bacterium]|nr:DNA cytosine methyltransferase [Spirochaetota bacterium]